MNRQEKLDVESGLRCLLEEMYALLNEKSPSLEYCSCSDLITRISRAFRQIKNTNSEYKKLELVLQQQEAEIRNHISLEQQMKLYQDGLQSKLDEATQEIKKLQSENHKLKKINAVNQNRKKRIEVMIAHKHLLKSNSHSRNMEAIHHIEVLAMSCSKGTTNCCSNNRPLLVNAPQIFK